VSEIGEPILGLLWLPLHRTAPARYGHHRVFQRKAGVARSDLCSPARQWHGGARRRLRGRGETLGHMRLEWDTNFRLVANQIEFGQPLPGRRGFDLLRTVDYVSTRPELTCEGWW